MKLNDYQLISPTSRKAVSLAQFNDDRLWTETTMEGRKARNKERDINISMKYRDTIGVIYRCIDIRSAMLSSLPWTILKGDEVFIESETAWEDEQYAWLENLTQFLSLTEASLLLSSEAFWLKEKNLLGSNTGIRWLAAPYVKPIYDEKRGIIYFERAYGNNKETFTPEDISYFWVQNPMSELMPDIPQVLAAANSADVILNYEEFVRSFYERGAVKATILKVDRSTPPKERARLRDFWKDFMSGNSNSYNTEVISGDVEAEVIGEGAGDSEKTEVLVSRRKDIATAMGVPYSLLFGDTSSSYTAGPTEEKNFLNYTVIPRAKMIQTVMNRSIFKEQGLYFRFNFGSLPAFKEAGEVVSKVFTTYTTALIPHSIAARIAGVTMPEGITYDDLDKYVAEERERQFQEKERIVTLNSKLVPDGQSGGKPSTGDKPKPKANANAAQDNNLKTEDEKRFRKWLKNRASNEIIDVKDFTSDLLDDSEKLDIYVKFLSERGGSEDNPPFGLSEVFTKALVTYGDEDNNSNVSGLAKLEKQATEDIANSFAEQVRIAKEESNNKDDEEFLQNIELWFEQSGEQLKTALIVALVGFAAVGVAHAVKNVRHFLPGFEAEAASIAAREWAGKRALEVYAVIQGTTLKKLRVIVNEWRMSGLPREWVFDEIQKLMDENRADVIAQSESIAVITQAALIVYDSTRLVRFVRFTAAMDERTCPICGRLHGNIYPINSAPKIPIHPRCRCSYRSVVDTSELRYFYEMERTP